MSDDVLTPTPITAAAQQHRIDAHAVEVHLYADHGWDVERADEAARCLATGECGLLHE